MTTYVIDIDRIIGIKSFRRFHEIFNLPLFPVDPKVIKKINKLFLKHKIILHTSRPRSLLIPTKLWLKNHNVKYHKLAMGKPYGDFYVDDRNMNKEEFLNEL